MVCKLARLAVISYTDIGREIFENVLSASIFMVSELLRHLDPHLSWPTSRTFDPQQQRCSGREDTQRGRRFDPLLAVEVA